MSPPFPTYTSGHSTFSGAADAVLTVLLGENVSFVASNDRQPAPGQRPIASEKVLFREFASFASAANEAGRSRVFGGVHFEFDNSAGLEAGRAIGRLVAGSIMRRTIL